MAELRVSCNFTQLIKETRAPSVKTCRSCNNNGNQAYKQMGRRPRNREIKQKGIAGYIRIYGERTAASTMYRLSIIKIIELDSAHELRLLFSSSPFCGRPTCV
jgi:hypothetical protein